MPWIRTASSRPVARGCGRRLSDHCEERSENEAASTREDGVCRLLLVAAAAAMAAEADVARGKSKFQRSCAPCHGAGPGDDGRAMLPGTTALQLKYKGTVPALLEARTDLPAAGGAHLRASRLVVHAAVSQDGAERRGDRRHRRIPGQRLRGRAPRPHADAPSERGVRWTAIRRSSAITGMSSRGITRSGGCAVCAASARRIDRALPAR